MRIGQGYDVHAFDQGVEQGGGDKIVIGGVVIAHSHGLIANSDGDVLLHALCDALLGAAAMGDIGRHFPDNDARYKNADSRSLLRLVLRKIRVQGWKVGNVDMTVVAQAPRMAPYIPRMVENIAADLEVGTDQVNVKATTTERLGLTGRKEGIAAQAVALLIAVDQ